MKITSGKVRRAYSEVGLEMCSGDFMSRDRSCCCPLTALSLQKLQKLKPSVYKALEGLFADSEVAEEIILEMLDIDKNFAQGFISGVDREAARMSAPDQWLEGYNLGFSIAKKLRIPQP